MCEILCENLVLEVLGVLWGYNRPSLLVGGYWVDDCGLEVSEILRLVSRPRVLSDSRNSESASVPLSHNPRVYTSGPHPHVVSGGTDGVRERGLGWNGVPPLWGQVSVGGTPNSRAHHDRVSLYYTSFLSLAPGIRVRGRGKIRKRFLLREPLRSSRDTLL